MLETTTRMSDTTALGVTAASPSSNPAAPATETAPSTQGASQGAAPNFPGTAADPGVTGGQDERVPYHRLKEVVEQKNSALAALNEMKAERERERAEFQAQMTELRQLATRDPLEVLQERYGKREPEVDPFADPLERQLTEQAARVQQLEQQMAASREAEQQRQLTAYFTDVRGKLATEFGDVPERVRDMAMVTALQKDPDPRTIGQRTREELTKLRTELGGWADKRRPAAELPPGGHIGSAGALTFDGEPKSFREAGARVRAMMRHHGA